MNPNQGTQIYEIRIECPHTSFFVPKICQSNYLKMSENEISMSIGMEQAGGNENSFEAQIKMDDDLQQASSTGLNVTAKVLPVNEDTRECGICREPFTSLSRMHPCGHRFDYDFVEAWFKKTLLHGSPQVADRDDEEDAEKPTICPMCRQDIQQIYHKYQADGTYEVVYPDEQFRGPVAARKAREVREAREARKIQEARAERHRHRRSELRASYNN